MEAVKTYQHPPSRALSDYLHAKAVKMRIPLSGTFELTPVCNFSCKMCYVRKTQAEVAEHPREIMTLDEWRLIAQNAKKAGMLYLLLTGGEPLLWPHFWTLYDELLDMGFLISINTNGSLINEEAIAHFKRRPPQRINITLYGANDQTYRQLCGVQGVFTKVDRAIRGLIEAGILVKINCSLTPNNANDLDWIIDYAKARGAIISVATYMFPPVRRDSSMIGVNERFTPEESAQYLMRYLERDRGPHAYQHYLENIRNGYREPPGLDESCIDPIDGRIRCRAGKSSFWITWDGWMTPCGMMPEPKTDLKTHCFDEAWEKIAKEAATLRLSGICAECPNNGICHPCAAIAYAETGNWTGIPTYMCNAVREMCRIARETPI